MTFDSIEYLLFFIVVFTFYWGVLKNSFKGQNVLLLAASYFFYGWWDWRFLSLIILSSFVDYLVALGIHKQTDAIKRKRLLWISLVVNLGMLGIFKYYNFFADSLEILCNNAGLQVDFLTLNVILPLGISFYTFQTLSYTIDVFKKKLEPTKDIISFFAFVSFFPQLVAGPIERAKDLLPQFYKPRKIDSGATVDACKQILWGFFKKLVVANNCGNIVDIIFENNDSLSGPVLVLGVILFAFQLYGDFSGYSDIAIGTARLLGFKLVQNFNTPYFSTSMSELWRRWHISLSTWANDYLFLPLSSALSRMKRKAIVLSLLITFLVIGIWHGANWTFVVFGIIHGTTVVIEFLTTKQRKLVSKKINIKLYNFLAWLITMLIWLLGLVFFRADSIGAAFSYLDNFRYSNSNPEITSTIFTTSFLALLVYLLIMLIMEWKNKAYLYGLQKISNHLVVRYTTYIVLLHLITEYFFEDRAFIYFQF